MPGKKLLSTCRLPRKTSSRNFSHYPRSEKNVDDGSSLGKLGRSFQGIEIASRETNSVGRFSTFLRLTFRFVFIFSWFPFLPLSLTLFLFYFFFFIRNSVLRERKTADGI